MVVAMDWRFGAFILLSISLTQVAGQGKCDKQSVKCSEDCKSVIACMGPNMAPITRACQTGQMCKEESGKVKCDATVTTCNAQSSSSVKVICGSKGELPHPTNCSTIFCTEVAKPASAKTPSDVCDCPPGQYADVTRPSFPCRTGSCPRSPVKCDKPYQNGKLPGASDYCYFCQKTDEILVYICNNGDTRRSAPNVRSSRSKKCVEVPPAGGGNENPTQPPPTQPPPTQPPPTQPPPTNQPPDQTQPTQPPDQTQPTQPPDQTQPTQPPDQTQPTPPTVQL